MRKQSRKLLALIMACLMMVPGGITTVSAASTQTTAVQTASSDNALVSSVTVSSKTANSKMARPTTLRAAGTNYKTIRLTWSKVNGAGGYYIYMATAQNGTYKKIGTRIGANATAANITNLVVRKNYFFRIRAYKGGEMSAYTGTVSAKTKETRAVISGISRSGSNAVNLKWGSIAGVNSYHVFRKKSGETKYKDIKTLNSKTTSFKDTGLASGTKYYYAIRPSYKIGSRYYFGTYSVVKSVVTGASTKYRALLVGETDYSKAHLSNLKGPENDVTVMSAILKQMKQPYTTTVRKNQSKASVMNLISTAFRGASDKDVSLFYYSGHGDTGYSSSDSGALVCTDGKSITMGELAKALAKVPGKVIVVLDSCGSAAGIYNTKQKSAAAGTSEMQLDPEAFGASASKAFAAVDQNLDSTATAAAKYGELRNSKFVVIAAARQWEYSYTAQLYGSTWGGVMTDGIARAAGCTYPNGTYKGSMPADTNKDNRLTLSELYWYTYNYVHNWSDDNQQSHASDDIQHVTVYPSVRSSYPVLIRK